MKIVCEACGAVSEATLETVDGTLRLRCGVCGHAHTPGESRSESGLPPESRDPGGPGPAPPLATVDVALEPLTEAGEALPPVKCPKCGHRQHDETACARCGLVFALVQDGRRPWEEFPPEQMPFVEEARRRWAAVEAEPGRVPAHVAFVDHCRAHDLLGFAAMRYRHRLADLPNDPIAREYLNRVVRDAQARVQVESEPDDFARTAQRVRQGLLVVVFILCVIATVLILRLMRPTGGVL